MGVSIVQMVHTREATTQEKRVLTEIIGSSLLFTVGTYTGLIMKKYVS
jgi:hypothetical protein